MDEASGPPDGIDGEWLIKKNIEKEKEWQNQGIKAKSCRGNKKRDAAKREKPAAHKYSNRFRQKKNEISLFFFYYLH